MGEARERLELDIELALRWAYQLELLHHDGLFGLGLPHLKTPGWVKLIDTGTVVDEGHEPRFPVGAGAPHPDALLLDFAVRALPERLLDWKSLKHRLLGDLAVWLGDDDWIAAGLGGPAPQRNVTVTFGVDRKGSKTVSASVGPPPQPVPTPSFARELVTMHARLNNRPVWDIGKPIVQRAKPALVGRQIAKNRYTEGSCCPLRLVPSALEFASARQEYAVWHAALVTLSRVELSAIKLLPPKAPARPWIDGEPDKEMTRVLPAGPSRFTTRLPLKPKRDQALPPIPTPAETQMRRQRADWQRLRKQRLTKPEDAA